MLKSGKALKTGVHFIAPLIMKVVSIKDSELVTAGVLTTSIEAKSKIIKLLRKSNLNLLFIDGTAINAYAVAYFKVTDAAKVKNNY